MFRLLVKAGDIWRLTAWKRTLPTSNPILALRQKPLQKKRIGHGDLLCKACAQSNVSKLRAPMRSIDLSGFLAAGIFR
jgi:hypothetical protein